MDFDQIALTRAELAALKKSSKGAAPVSQCERLLRFKLVEEEYKHVPGYQGKPLGVCRITDKGRDYLISYRRSLHMLWLKSVWIPVIAAFLTSICTHYLLPMLPELLQWSGQTLSKILSGSFSSWSP